MPSVPGCSPSSRNGNELGNSVGNNNGNGVVGNITVEGGGLYNAGGATLISASVSGNSAKSTVTNGSLNGISFYESPAAKAMSFGYDGSGGAAVNSLRIYSSTDIPLFTFQNGGSAVSTITSRCAVTFASPL